MRVVVTRRLAEAVETAERLRELGHEPIVMPLTEIVALPGQSVETSGAQCVAVTSANALRHADPEIIDKIRHLPLLAVGDRTADEARALGFEKVESASGDAQALAQLALRRLEAGGTLLYLCGQVRRSEFETVLADAGRRVRAVETYATRLIEPEPDAAAAIGQSDAVMVYAQSAAQALNEIGISKSKAAFICISNRVAQALEAPIANIRVAERPDELSMLIEIDRLP